MFTKPQAPPPPVAKDIASQILATVDSQIAQRRDNYVKLMQAFWAGPAPASEVLSYMGVEATLLLDVANEDLRHLAATATLEGKTLEDILPPEFLEIPTLVRHPDGSVTLPEE
jgi:hypothetical protein